MEDLTFDNLEFAENPDPRAALVLVLDQSDSMVEKRPGEDRSPMEALNGGLDVLVTALNNDPLAKRRVEVSFVCFGTNVQPATEFKTVDNLVLPTLAPAGITSLGAAVTEALDALEARKKVYKENGVDYTRPWVMILSDGLPTDDITEAVRRCNEAEEKKSALIFPIGIDGADMDVLDRFSARKALKLKGIKFEELFQWVSASQSAVSASRPGDKTALPSPAGWAEIDV